MPTPVTGPFTPDFSKINFDVIAGHIAAVAAEIAKATPSPLDDIAVTYLAQVLTDFLKTKLAQQASGVMFAESDEADTEKIKAAFAAKGKILSPEMLQMILGLAKSLLPIILPLLV